MAHEETPLNAEAVCKVVGRLYLEYQLNLDSLTRRLAKAEAERDEALALLRPKKD